MTRLYLVRHGTHDLVGRVLAGRSPGVHLSEEGRRQAESLATLFSIQSAIAAVVSSPLERCRETAAPIAARLGLDVLESEELNEIDCGDWTGASFEALGADPRWRRWNRDRSGTVVPGGEPATAVRSRAMSLVESYATGDRGAVVMVTHSDIIKTVMLTLLGASLDFHDRLEIEPAGVTTVDLWDGGGKIVRSNQVVA